MSRPSRPAGLPVRDGVSPSCVAVSGQHACVLDFLAQRLPVLSRQDWAARLQAGEVLDADARPLAAHAPCRPGQRLFYYRGWADESPAPEAERIVFQDDWLVVADKPHFMPVTPGGRFVQRSLLVRLKRRLGLPALSPIHRIDRDTAGLVVFAVQPHTRQAYQALFRHQQVRKTYEAIAPELPALALPHTRESRIEPDAQRFFLSREVDGTPNSRTLLAAATPVGLRDGAPCALYRLHPASGQRHQLRLHLCGLGAPILGDAFYPRVRHAEGEPDDTRHPLQLLARALAFDDPITGQARHFVSGLTLARLHEAHQAHDAPVQPAGGGKLECSLYAGGGAPL